MKILENILLALMVFSLYSCNKESSEPENLIPVESLGLMEVEITQKEGTEEDRMETVRFIVFKNILGVIPDLELNERFDIPAVDPGDKEVSGFKIVLEVSRRISGNNDKLVVAIINEPPVLKSQLDAISSYSQLENIELDFAGFMNADHHTLQDGKLMPMTGVIRTNKVYATPEEAESDAILLQVQRAVARVDIYLSQEAGLGMDLASGTTVTLSNTYDKEYLVRSKNGSVSFGKIHTVTSGLLSKTWTIKTSDSKYLPEYAGNNSGRLVCSFYTAERTCSAVNNSDKLILDLQVVTNEGVTRSGNVVIDKFKLDGVQTDIHNIDRNNIYQILSTVTSNSITSVVLDWNNEDIQTEF